MKNNTFKALLYLAPLALLGNGCQTSKIVEVRPLAMPQMAQAQPETGSYYRAGKSYLAKGDYGLAIDAFRNSLKQGEDEFSALNGLAITYDMLGRFDLSQKYYERALELDSGSPVTYSNLAYSQHLQGEYKNAVKLAAMAEKMVDGGSNAKAVALARTITGNAALARQANETVLLAEAAPEQQGKQYEIERVSLKNWEMVEKPVIPQKKPLKYKANVPVDSIIAKAGKKAPESQNTDETMTVTAEAGPIEHAAVTPQKKPVLMMQQSRQAGSVPQVRQADDTPQTRQGASMQMARQAGSMPRARQAGSLPQAKVIKAAMVVPGVKPSVALKDKPAEQADGRENIEEVSLQVPLPAHKPAHTLSYRILNATGRRYMAKRMLKFMQDSGLRIFSYGNADHFNRKQSVILHAPGHRRKALEMAEILPVPVEITEDRDLSADAVLLMGEDLLPFDSSLRKKHYDI